VIGCGRETRRIVCEGSKRLSQPLRIAGVDDERICAGGPTSPSGDIAILVAADRQDEDPRERMEPLDLPDQEEIGCVLERQGKDDQLRAETVRRAGCILLGTFAADAKPREKLNDRPAGAAQTGMLGSDQDVDNTA
jgi:hypothetical protein